MSQNQEKTICCRVDEDFFELLQVLTKCKGQKLSSYIRTTLSTAVADELRQLGIISSAHVEKVLSKQKQNLTASLGELTAQAEEFTPEAVDTASD